MASVKLIADSGATKAEWALLADGKHKIINTMKTKTIEKLNDGDYCKVVEGNTYRKIRHSKRHQPISLSE